MASLLSLARECLLIVYLEDFGHVLFEFFLPCTHLDGCDVVVFFDLLDRLLIFGVSGQQNLSIQIE